MKSRPDPPPELCVFITAADPAGDSLAARLMRQLRAQVAPFPIRFEGVGGEQMEAQGLTSLFPLRDLSGTGQCLGAMARLPLLLRRIRQTAIWMTKVRPDLFISIDAPEFNFRLARRFHHMATRLPVMVHYGAPTITARPPEDPAGIARLYDAMLCRFPGEPRHFNREGMLAHFVGHPILENGHGLADGGFLRRRLRIPPDTLVIGALFGSTPGELRHTGPVLRDALAQLSARYPRAHLIALTLPHLERDVRALTWPLPNPCHLLVDQQLKGDAFAAMDVAVAASGTVGLELALAGVPHTVAQRRNPLAWTILRRRVRTVYAHPLNHLLDRPAVDEHIQENCRAQPIADSIISLLTRRRTADAQRAAFRQATGLLGGSPGEEAPSARAASCILSLLRGVPLPPLVSPDRRWSGFPARSSFPSPVAAETDD